MTSASPAANMTAVYNTVGSSLKPECVDGRFLSLTLPKNGDAVSLFAFGAHGFRVNSENMQNILTAENGLGVLVRLTYAVAVPFFASYFALYSVGCFAVTGILSGIAQFRGEHDACKSLAILAMTHAAYAVYNMAMSYIASASILYLPAAALLYAVSPNLLKQADQFLHTHREPQAVIEEALEADLADFAAIACERAQAPEAAVSPYATIEPLAKVFREKYAAYRATRSAEEKRGLVEGGIPGRIRSFMESVMVRPEAAPSSFLSRLFSRA